MRAAQVITLGQPPSPGEAPDPQRGEGQALVEVAAAPINPIDLAIGSGRFYGGSPDTPYVPGVEGLGVVVEGDRIAAGTRIYFSTRGGSNGSLATHAAVLEDEAFEVPAGVDDTLAACLGVAGLAAWLPLEWRAELREGETVLVLGASGAVGAIAVQAAKLLGAGRVVAAARSGEGLERALALGADAAVQVGGQEDLAGAFREAAGGDIHVTIDPVWGEPMLAAAAASAPGGRIVNLGQSAAPEAALTSAAVRGKMLAILGHSNFLAPVEVRESAYRRMCEHAAAGRLAVDRDTFELDDVASAWQRQAEYPHRKLVGVPRPG